MGGFDLDAWLATQKTRVEALLSARMKAIGGRASRSWPRRWRTRCSMGASGCVPSCAWRSRRVAGSSRGGSDAADDAACAVEMIHTYSLVHDDLPAMDDDDLRRGRPTTHKVYGEAMAILAGDALLTDAFGALGGDGPVRGRLCAELALAAGGGGMVGGQVLDIAEDRPAEEGYLLKLHRMKTGALIKCACRMGAIAGGGGAEALEAAETYGDAVGLAFQIADDLLDVTSSAAAMGKPTGADAAAGRHTFPAVVGLERSAALAREQVQRAKPRLPRSSRSRARWPPWPAIRWSASTEERAPRRAARGARSRADPRQGPELILAGQVVVDDARIDKPGTRVSVDADVRLKGEVLKYVSRGGLKLEAALDAFALDPKGLVCADIGASTGRLHRLPAAARSGEGARHRRGPRAAAPEAPRRPARHFTRGRERAPPE